MVQVCVCVCVCVCVSVCVRACVCAYIISVSILYGTEQFLELQQTKEQLMTH